MWQKVFGTKTYAFVIVGIMLIGVIPAARQLPLIELQDDLATWLSKDDEHARALQELESYFPPEERILVFRLIDDDAQRPGLLGVVDFPIPQAIPPQDECDRSVERAVGQRSASEPVVAQLRNIAQWRRQLAAGGFWAVAEQRVDAR